MKYLKFHTIIFMFAFFAGTLFLVQCDSDTNQEDMGLTQEDTAGDQTETTYPQSQTPEGEMGFQQERQALLTDLEELRDSINVTLNNRGDVAGDASEIEELENDANELDQTITNLQNATEDNWAQIRTETQRVFQRMQAKYNDEATNTPPNNPTN